MSKPTPLDKLKRAQRHIALAQQAINAVIAQSSDAITTADLKTAIADLKCASGRIEGIEKRLEKEEESKKQGDQPPTTQAGQPLS